MSHAIRIKKTPIAILKNLVMAEFVTTILYQIAAYMADYGQLYGQFAVSHSLPYEIAKLLVKLSAETWIIGYVMLRWYFFTIYMYPDKIAVRSGVVFRRTVIKNIAQPITISYAFGFLSRLFSYGTMIIKDATGTLMVFKEMPNPLYYGEQFQKVIATTHKNGDTKELPAQIADVLREREHERLEFKSTFRWDTKEKKINRGLEKAVIKTVAGFLNSDGGVLVIGVDDEKKVHGIHHDYQTLPRPDIDGFENHFNNIFTDAIGAQFRRLVRLDFQPHDELMVCMVKVNPSDKPVYVKMDNAEHFFVRTGNATVALPVSEIAGYAKSRWG